MTRYTRYPKKFNTTTIAEDNLSRAEQNQIKESKEQDLDDLRLSKNQRSKPVCLRCRKRGHSVKFCPQGVDSICYNCGSHAHTLKNCRQPRSSELKFANCYICKQTGHLASGCPTNPNGIYPRGGGCRFCGSNQHLARDCRPNKQAEKGNFIAASVDPKKENPDDDLMFESLHKIESEREQKSEKKRSRAETEPLKKAKMVKF